MSLAEFCRLYNVERTAIHRWTIKYDNKGLEGLKEIKKPTKYSSHTLIHAVEDYLTGNFSMLQIVKIYNLSGDAVLRTWLKWYNTPKWNIKVAVLIPSVLFGLVHIIGMDFSIISSLLVLIAGTMVGIMFSMVAIESGSVWNSGIVHSLWNILIIGGGLSISEKADEYSVMTYVLDSKDFVFTGGEFGIESSIIALLGYVIVTLAAICMIKKKAKV